MKPAFDANEERRKVELWTTVYFANRHNQTGGYVEEFLNNGQEEICQILLDFFRERGAYRRLTLGPDKDRAVAQAKEEMVQRLCAAFDAFAEEEAKQDAYRELSYGPDEDSLRDLKRDREKGGL